MKGALDSGASGVNVLLYVPPGTGKTQFCKVLAEKLGVTLFSVGESDDDGTSLHVARGSRSFGSPNDFSPEAGGPFCSLTRWRTCSATPFRISDSSALVQLPRPGGQLESLHAPAARAGADPHAVDHEQCSRRQRRGFCAA